MIKHSSMDTQQHATVLSYDILSDIALLKPSRPISIDNYPEISTSEPVAGSAVTAIGYPSDPMPPSTLTTGVIPSTDSDENGITYIKIDAAVNPGSSGGPVFSEHGNIIGLMVSKRMKSEGEAWAISSQTLSELLPQLKSYTRPLTDTGGGAITSGEPRTGSIEMPGDTDVYTFSGTYGAMAQIKLQGDGPVFGLSRSNSSSGYRSDTVAINQTGLKTFDLRLYSNLTPSLTVYYFVTVSSPSVTHGNPQPYTLTIRYTDPPT